MQYQTFKGADVNQALSRVKAACGPDAIIYSTRKVSNGRGGALGSHYVEIEAAPPNERFNWGFQDPRSKHPTERASAAPARPWSGGRRGHGTPTLGLDVHQLQREIGTLRAMLEDLNASRPPKQRALSMLASWGVELGLARTLVTGSTRAARRGELALRHWLADQLRDRIQVAQEFLTCQEPTVVFAVGQTGVGKTTSLAKIAARARLDYGHPVTVITLDTFRVGALEQWQRYANLMGVTLRVARSVEEFENTLAEVRTPLVLVDTAGRSTASDSDWIVPGCVQAVENRNTHVMLVLPAWTRGSDAERVVKGYLDAGLTGICVTKLDETVQYGGIVHAALPQELPIYYLCDGPRVPEDIQPATIDAVVAALTEGSN